MRWPSRACLNQKTCLTHSCSDCIVAFTDRFHSLIGAVASKLTGRCFFFQCSETETGRPCERRNMQWEEEGVVRYNDAAPNSLQQAEEVHDVLGVDLVPVGIQSVWEKMRRQRIVIHLLDMRVALVLRQGNERKPKHQPSSKQCCVKCLERTLKYKDTACSQHCREGWEHQFPLDILTILILRSTQAALKCKQLSIWASLAFLQHWCRSFTSGLKRQANLSIYVGFHEHKYSSFCSVFLRGSTRGCWSLSLHMVEGRVPPE